MKLFGWLSVVCAVVGVDQLTKLLAANSGWVSLNEGMAFGWGDDRFLIVHVIALLLIIGWVVQAKHSSERWPLVLVSSAGASNLLDRLRLGGVQDWLAIPGTNLRNNLADYFVVIGFAWWFYTMYQAERSSKHDNQHTVSRY